MSDLLKQIKDLEDIVNNHEESFLKYFVTGDTILGLNGIWFGSENIRFYYIAWEGMHIVETIKWEEFNKWLKRIK